MIPANFANLWSADRKLQNQAFFHFLALTDSPVDWAYEVWEIVVENLTHKDNHNRAIAAQILCNLAKSDPQIRLANDFEALFSVTRDKRFVTARHCMQSLWKVGVVASQQREMLATVLEERFDDCAFEKNCTLIRYDIIQSLRNVYDAVGDDNVKTLALRLIDSEEDLKYRKKYSTLWRSK